MIFKNWFLYSILAIGLFSCLGSRKMQQVSGTLDHLGAQQISEARQVAAIDSTGAAKLAEGKIDSNIDNRLRQRLTLMQHRLDSVHQQIDGLQKLVASKKSFRSSYKKEIVPEIAQLDTFYKKYDDRIKIYVMLKDGLDMANYVLFDLAAFFGPGVYSIPADKEALAEKSFLPLIDSLASFSNKYQQEPRTATLVILGFADGQSINPESGLQDTLVKMIGNTDTSKQALNQKLSELRARELIRQLALLFKKRESDFKNMDSLTVEYIGQGKGEAFPIPTIKDYKEDDERRRIVLCYWAVLPKMQ